MKTLVRRTFAVLLIVLAGLLLAFSAMAVLRERESARSAAPAGGSFVQAHDIEMFVQTAGKKGNPPVVLVHGMAAWSETWRPVMDMLAERGWYVIAVDMPPFGFSERPQDGDFWRVAQAHRIAGLLDSLSLRQVTVVGHSYGSRAVLETALRYPERIKGLVLVDPALSGIYSDATTTPSAATVVITNTLLRYPVVASTMTNPLLSRKLLTAFLHDPADATDEIVAVYRRPSVLSGSTADMGAWLRGFMTGADQGLSSDKTKYASLKNTALIWGEEDTTTPLAQGIALQKMIPGSTLLTMPGVGHIPHIEDIDAFNRALLAALTSLD